MVLAAFLSARFTPQRASGVHKSYFQSTVAPEPAPHFRADHRLGGFWLFNRGFEVIPHLKNRQLKLVVPAAQVMCFELVLCALWALKRSGWLNSTLELICVESVVTLIWQGRAVTPRRSSRARKLLGRLAPSDFKSDFGMLIF